MKKYIPSLFTLANLCCGAIAIMIGDLYISSMFILGGLLLDVFDGASARMLDAQSELGKQLDSLSDLITFGMAPVYLYFLQAPGLEWYLYIGPLVLLMCGALRLGKFNTLPSSKYFIGLPIPAAAIFFLGLFLAHDVNNHLVESIFISHIKYTAVPIIIGLLMISRMTMFSLKGLNKNPRSYIPLGLLIICTSILIYFNWRLAFSGLVIFYILISLLTTPRDNELKLD